MDGRRVRISAFINQPLAHFKGNETLNPLAFSHIDQSLIRLVPELHEDMIGPEPATGRE